MSEPTYRVELVHEPLNPAATAWCATVRLAAFPDDVPLAHGYGLTADEALGKAKAYCRNRGTDTELQVYLLTEDGDILDPHEVQR